MNLIYEKVRSEAEVWMAMEATRRITVSACGNIHTLVTLLRDSPEGIDAMEAAYRLLSLPDGCELRVVRQAESAPVEDWGMWL